MKQTIHHKHIIRGTTKNIDIYELPEGNLHVIGKPYLIPSFDQDVEFGAHHRFVKSMPIHGVIPISGEINPDTDKHSPILLGIVGVVMVISFSLSIGIWIGMHGR